VIEIVKLKSGAEIASLLQLDHNNLKNSFNCEKTEWIQWLINMVESEDVVIMACVVDGDLVNYTVLISHVYPPVQDSISIFYLCDTINFEDKDGKKLRNRLLSEIKRWAIEQGAKKIDVFRKDIDFLNFFSFKEDKVFFKMTMEI